MIKLNTFCGSCGVVLPGGFPFTVLSQLTTGPMLDAIAPEDQIGFIQGVSVLIVRAFLARCSNSFSASSVK